MQDIFARYHIDLSPEELLSFERFLSVFMEYNAHTNLSAIREKDAIIEKHFIDSIFLLTQTEISGRVLDIGTGGGFPGIPLKIVAPHLDMVLLDSVGKKTRACQHFISTLGLTNISVIHDRCENISKLPAYRHTFDVIVSRATAYLPQILTWAAPFLSPHGRIILYKLPSKDELAAATEAMDISGLELQEEISYTIAWQERVYWIFGKSQ